MKKRQTRFQGFLKSKGACAAAREFVATHGGNFAAAWKANTDKSWTEWLGNAIVGGHSNNQLTCAACKMRDKTHVGQRRAIVALARKRGWMK